MEIRPFVGKARALLAIVILAGFVVNAGFMAWYDRSKALEQAESRALTFAELTRDPIVEILSDRMSHVRADRGPSTRPSLHVIEHMAPALVVAMVTIAAMWPLLRRSA
jgi:hypothetical protein